MIDVNVDDYYKDIGGKFFNNDDDVNKIKKFCYLIKFRWWYYWASSSLNHLQSRTL